jgi:hypothetical protein
MERDSGSYGYTSPTVIVNCKKCNIRFSEPTEEWQQGKGTYSIEESAIAKLVNRWNTRANVKVRGRPLLGDPS